jgi:hypothetical protein
MFVILFPICLLNHALSQIYTGKPPFLDTPKSAAAIILAVLRGERPLLPPPGCWSSEEEQLWWLVDLCWKGKPEERPEMRLVKNTLRDIATCKSPKAIIPLALQVESNELQVDLTAVQEWLRNESSFEVSGPRALYPESTLKPIIRTLSRSVRTILIIVRKTTLLDRTRIYSR